MGLSENKANVASLDAGAVQYWLESHFREDIVGMSEQCQRDLLALHLTYYPPPVDVKVKVVDDWFQW